MHFKRGVWGKARASSLALGLISRPPTLGPRVISQPPRLRSKANDQGRWQGAVQMRLITIPIVRQNACKPRRS